MTCDISKCSVHLVKLLKMSVKSDLVLEFNSSKSETRQRKNEFKIHVLNIRWTIKWSHLFFFQRLNDSGDYRTEAERINIPEEIFKSFHAGHATRKFDSRYLNKLSDAESFSVSWQRICWSKFLPSMKSEALLPCSKQSATGHPGPNESNQHPHTIFLKINFT
jgi:hypothetical protein